MAAPQKNPPAEPVIKTVATNRKARHLYTILETFEAGIELKGPEVKSLRAGGGGISESFARFDGAELFVLGMNISPYDAANRWNPDPLRPRRLLMHRHELRRLIGKTEQKGLTIIPLKMYFKDSRVKVELGLAQGKKIHDKRETIKRRDQERDAQREISKRFRR